MAKVFDEERTSRNPVPDRHTELGLAGEEVVAMYRSALLARTLDQRMWNLNRQGRARFVISGQGQEGTQVGSAWALRAGLRHRPALLPRLRRGPHPGHDPLRGVPGRAGPGRRPQLGRPADAQPLGLPAAEHHHRVVPHRHPAAPRRRPGPGVGHPGRRPGHRVLVRRGGVVEGRLPRGPQLRRHPPPAGGLRVREQPVRHLGDDGPAVGRARRGRPGLVLRHAGGDRRRQRHPGGVRGGAIGRGPGPVGRRSVAGRVQDVPASAPHVRRRRPPLPQSGGGAGVAGARPSAPAAPVSGRSGSPVGGRGRGHGAGGAGRDRRGRPAGGGGGPAVARDRLPPGVRQAAAAHAGRPGRARRGAGPGSGGAATAGHGRGPHRARLRPPDAARPDGRGRAGGASWARTWACSGACSGPPTGCTRRSGRRG